MILTFCVFNDFITIEINLFYASCLWFNVELLLETVELTNSVLYFTVQKKFTFIILKSA